MVLSLSPVLRHKLSLVGALIFDLDGTLVHTHEAHERSWRRAFAGVGLHMSGSWYHERTGLTADQLVNEMGRNYKTRLNAASIKAAELAYFLEETPALVPFAPVFSIAKEFGDTCHMAVASNGDGKTVQATLAGAGISDMFSVIVTADEVQRPKPFPDLFLLAAKGMDVEPGECLAFEDSDSGLDAARAAGMSVVDVRTWELRDACGCVVEAE
ncbi:HAD family phosphatase [Actinomyces sp.]|uniref:HAD family hydrolase n=1 Tax=Actinomyces sp. TaxID=29317 RepID=UPI0026DD0D8D|nr:HAD family phosphatase [Actinomyces sp.]MDO4899867.1 HAD family phosphatase [Actinomyces sp.]